MSLRQRLLPLALVLLVRGLFSPLPFLSPAAAGCGPAGDTRPDDLRFLVLGDWGRGGSRVQREVAGQMASTAAHGAAFVITTGDNFYEGGVVSVDDPSWSRSFRAVYASPCLDIPWHPVLGNHDYRGVPAAQVDYSRLDSRWTMPGRYYSFRKRAPGGEVLFVFLDTSPFIGRYRWTGWRYPDLSSQDPAVQLDWLESTLAEGAAWKVVVGHHPVFSGGLFHGPARELRERVMPLLRKYEVTVYFSGHEHNLQHLKPPGVTHYVISGGGSGARPAGTTEDTLFAAGTPGFVAGTFSREGLRLHFMDSRGEELYQTLIVR